MRAHEAFSMYTYCRLCVHAHTRQVWQGQNRTQSALHFVYMMMQKPRTLCVFFFHLWFCMFSSFVLTHSLTPIFAIEFDVSEYVGWQHFIEIKNETTFLLVISMKLFLCSIQVDGSYFSSFFLLHFSFGSTDDLSNLAMKCDKIHF